ncbi:MAG: hypothetical protein KGQ80_08655, partial [Bacteroidetes bacterium]|nr:hypothetical protein [Bacteroidota bacterium]
RMAELTAHKSLLLVAGQQTAGRGQRGQTWESDAGLNLLCTWLIEGDGLPASSALLLNMAVACALCDTGKQWMGSRSKIKWPNDLWCLPKKMSPNISTVDAPAEKVAKTTNESVKTTNESVKTTNESIKTTNESVKEIKSPDQMEQSIPDRGGKWGGILIENQMTGMLCRQSAIGFGLNINQVHFGPHLAQATSLKAQTTHEVSLHEVLQTAIQNIQYWLRKVKSNESETIAEGYTDRLWGMGEFCDFLIGGKKIRARIDGIDPKTGALMLFDGQQSMSGLHPLCRHDLSGPECEAPEWDSPKECVRPSSNIQYHE